MLKKIFLLKIYKIIFIIVLINAFVYAKSDLKEIDEKVNHALIIGANKYNEFPNLKTPSNDAQSLFNILIEKYNFSSTNTILVNDLSQTKPTYANIIEYLDNYQKNLTNKDNLLLYFSGYSSEDDDGNTYWIPSDGVNNIKTKQNWIDHSHLCKKYFFSNEFKANNLFIIADSYFSINLYRKMELTKMNSDKYNSKGSRELLSFGEMHWKNKSHDNGLFTTLLVDILKNNNNKNISINELLTNNKSQISILESITGTSISYARLRTNTDNLGYFTIKRTLALPVVNVIDSCVVPQKSYIGKSSIIYATTDKKAKEVIIETGHDKYQMEGFNTSWKYKYEHIDIGNTNYKIFALNDDLIEGQFIEGSLTTVKKPLLPTNVVNLSVKPENGKPGTKFVFKAKTDKVPSEIFLIIDDEKYPMTGFGLEWIFKHNLYKPKKYKYLVIAKNSDNIYGKSKKGYVDIKAHIVKLLNANVNPKAGYINDKFNFYVKTNNTANEAFIIIDDITYSMEGSGRNWYFEKIFYNAATKNFSAYAINDTLVKSNIIHGKFSVLQRPVEIPDVNEVVLYPDNIYKDELFVIKVKTNTNAEKVLLKIGNHNNYMDGNGKEWIFVTKTKESGTQRFMVIAQNNRGMHGIAKNGVFTVSEPNSNAIRIEKNEIDNDIIHYCQNVSFTANTNGVAKSVDLFIEGKKYPMKGYAKNWSLNKKICSLGTMFYTLLPTNIYGIKGVAKIGKLKVESGQVSIKNVKISPDIIFPDDTIKIVVDTDSYAKNVSIVFDGITYPMSSNKGEWEFTKKIANYSNFDFTINPYNMNNYKGKSYNGKIIVKTKVHKIPDIINSKYICFSPDNYTDEKYMIVCETNEDAYEVFIEIDKKLYNMDGSDKNWSFQTQINTSGTVNYKIFAKNIKGKQGKSYLGQIKIKKRPLDIVNVIEASSDKTEALVGHSFNFSLMTDKPASQALIYIGDDKFFMNGSNDKWSLTKTIENSGLVSYYMVALNKDNHEGFGKSSVLNVKKLEIKYEYLQDGTIKNILDNSIQKRFVDIGDSTIIDRLTNLMWLKQPKQIAVSYKDAVDYCDSIIISDYTGWRLPTIHEWKSFIDMNQENPCLPPKHPFINVNTGIGYWSKTRHRFGSQYVYKMGMWYGKSGYINKNQKAIVWPVRYHIQNNYKKEIIK